MKTTDKNMVTRARAKAIIMAFVILFTVGVFAVMAFSPGDATHPGSKTGHDMSGMPMEGHDMTGH